MNKHILRYSIGMVFLLLFGACDKFDRTEVVPEIYVNKSEISGFIGEEVQLSASPTDGSYSFEWMSEDPEVATVTNNGLVKLVKEGFTTVVLSAGDIKQRVSISSLTRIPVADIILSDASVELTPQSKKVITFKYLPDNANDVPTAVWSSENANIAVVSDVGEITGVSEGTTSIVYAVGTVSKKVTVMVSYTSPFGGPYNLKAGPTVEVLAANFDFGGPGRAFNDDAANPLNDDSYRRGKGDANSFGVEVEGPGNNIGFINNGEWYQYSVDVKEAGKYSLQISLSAVAAGSYHIEVDNVNVTGTINVPSNGAWASWVNHPGTPLVLDLAEGRRKIKFVVEQATYNIRALRFTKQ